MGSPLYALRQGQDHLYVISTAQRDNAVSLGYTYVGVAGHVWLSP